MDWFNLMLQHFDAFFMSESCQVFRFYVKTKILGPQLHATACSEFLVPIFTLASVQVFGCQEKQNRSRILDQNQIYPLILQVKKVGIRKGMVGVGTIELLITTFPEDSEKMSPNLHLNSHYSAKSYHVHDHTFHFWASYHFAFRSRVENHLKGCSFHTGGDIQKRNCRGGA